MVFHLDEAGGSKLVMFTTAFRKVRDLDLGNLTVGDQTVTLDLKDSWGHDLANGLYYGLLVQGSHRTLGKLLISR